jgi:hypothetical protein
LGAGWRRGWRRRCSRTRNWGLRGFPEIGRDERFRFFTLTPADIAFVDPGRGRGPADRLSLAVALCTAEWYVREETLRAANLAIIGYHGTLPLTPVFGTGTLSSSDGQRFPVRGMTLTGRDMVIHGGQSSRPARM